ncbi:MAG: MTAP family purine nucleoside phosphorylase [Herminiimonas sp.]|nr:MTAP family purine nucleoside phosphorylase [Herminiimonas sp.]
MLAIIGGTGLYQMAGLEVIDTVQPQTPFGLPSSPILRGTLGGRPLLFLARHGAAHQHLPHEINYRANIFALKSLGATHVLGVSAVGSLRKAIAPGQIAIPNQYFDWTRGRRAASFFGAGVAAHVSTAHPVSGLLVDWVAAHAQRLGVPLHLGVTYACVEGPRLGTQAESHFLRQSGCDLVGMTNVPEAFLAREAQLAYATIAIATDYDCWLDDPSQHVTVESILARYRDSLTLVLGLLAYIAAQPLPTIEPAIRQALALAMMTPETALDDAQRAWLDVLRA